jgi:hypothetical protein
MVTRAVKRHTFMRDRPAYEAFLQHIDSRDNVWKVPQRTIAQWWERRQKSVLNISITESGTLRISCDLTDGVIEIDGKMLFIPPADLSITTSIPAGPVAITCGSRTEDREFLAELLGHLGYGHIVPVRRDDASDIREEEVTPALRALREEAVTKVRYEPDTLAKLRSLFTRAHHDRGIPDIRLWTLPHSDGSPYRVAVSTRYDVDKAIMLLPRIYELEARYNLRSTAYVRPMGFFYGEKEIKRFTDAAGGFEIALHGEFVTTARNHDSDEFTAARMEKQKLEEIIDGEVEGVCMHGGELHSNTTEQTPDAIDAARYRYDTIYRNRYYLPLRVPGGTGLRSTLSIGQHYADISTPPDSRFSRDLLGAFMTHFSNAARVGGVFVPVLHPLYFDFVRYIANPVNLYRLTSFMPKFFIAASRMKRGQHYVNR